MKTIPLFSLAVVLLTTTGLAQEGDLRRLPSIETRLGQVENQLTSLMNENAELRELLENQSCACEICDCDCTCPGINFSVDWLYWQLHQDGLDYATGNTIAAVPQIVTTYEIDMARDSGMRSRIGYLMPSGWEAAFAYTYFDTVGQGPRLIYTGLDPTGNIVSTRGDQYQFYFDAVGAVEASFTFRQNIYDVEISHWLAIHNALALRMFAGYRHATIDQTFLTSTDIGGFGFWDNIETVNTNADGLRLGTEGRWMVTQNVTLSGTLAGSVLYAYTDKRLTSIPFGAIARVQSWNGSHALPVLEAAVSATLQRGPFELAVGYELSTWFGLGNLPHSFERALVPARRNYDILLEGLFLRAVFTH